jgi:hypothetical protein
LNFGDDAVHGAQDPRSLLQALETLPSLSEDIGIGGIKEILFSKIPKTENLVKNSTPKSETLENEGKLTLMIVCQTAPIDAFRDCKRSLRFIREVVLKIGNELINWFSIESEEGVEVAYGV